MVVVHIYEETKRNLKVGLLLVISQFSKITAEPTKLFGVPSSLDVIIIAGIFGPSLRITIAEQ